MDGWMDRLVIFSRVGARMGWMDLESPRFMISCVNNFELINQLLLYIIQYDTSDRTMVLSCRHSERRHLDLEQQPAVPGEHHPVERHPVGRGRSGPHPELQHGLPPSMYVRPRAHPCPPACALASLYY